MAANPPRASGSGDSGSQLMRCSLLSFGLALGVLSRSKWGPLLEPSVSVFTTPAVVARATPIYAAVSGAHAYVLWMFNRLLNQAYDYRGADRAALVTVALLCIDVVANLYLALSGQPGFQVYPIPLGLYGLMLSYSHFAYFGLGVALIAWGYSLLRLPYALYGLARPYAQAQIATGAALAAPPLAALWPWPAAVGHVLLGLLLFRASTRPGAAFGPSSGRDLR